jgi:hypothetical protein
MFTIYPGDDVNSDTMLFLCIYSSESGVSSVTTYTNLSDLKRNINAYISEVYEGDIDPYDVYNVQVFTQQYSGSQVATLQVLCLMKDNQDPDKISTLFHDPLSLGYEPNKPKVKIEITPTKTQKYEFKTTSYGTYADKFLDEAILNEVAANKITFTTNTPQNEYYAPDQKGYSVHKFATTADDQNPTQEIIKENF